MFDFQDAEYIKPEGPGRTREPNPFTDVIAAIALKRDSNDKPVAKSFVAEHDEDKRDTTVSRIKRQMSEAGAENDPKVSVYVVAEPVKNPVNKTESKTKTRITFWTAPRQTRKRKNVTESADAATSAE